MYNRSIVDEVRVARIQLSDTTMPLLRVWYCLGPQTGEDPNTLVNYHTLAADANGSSASKLLVTLRIGKGNGTDGSAGTALSSAASTTYEFSASGVAVVSGATATAVTTLGALVSALNAIDGVKAVRLNAPADYSLDTDDFIDITEFDLSAKPTDVLYKDASEVVTTAVRVGIPEPQDAGRIKIVEISGTCTGVTSGVLKVSQDPSDTSASDEVEYFNEALAAAQTDYIGDTGRDPFTYRGPLLVEVTSSDLSAVDIKVRYQNAEW